MTAKSVLILVLIAGFLVQIGGSYAAVDLLGDIYAYYPFDEAYNYNDSTPAARHMNMSGGSFTHPGHSPGGILSGQLVFDGLGNSIKNLSGNNFRNFSLSAWLRPDDVNNYFLYGVNNGPNTVISIHSEGGIDRGNMMLYDGSSWVTYPASKITASTTRFFVWTFNSTDNSTSLYINGVLNSSTTFDGNVTFEEYYLGAWTGCGVPCTQSYDGRADEVGMWNKTLNAQEISELFNGGSGLAYNFTNSLNINFTDEITGGPVNNVFMTAFAPNNESANYTTSNGRISVGKQTGWYEFVYKDTNDQYHQRKYFYNSTNFGNSEVEFFLLNKTDSNTALVTYEVTDESGIPLQGAIVKMLRRFNDDGNDVFKVVEMSQSDVSGTGAFHLEQIEASYKFIVEYQQATVLTTSASEIFENAITLRSTLSESVIESLVTVSGLGETITYNNNTNNVTLSWNDPSGVIESVCLYVERYRGIGITTINSSCLTAATGSITLGTGNASGEYVARGEVNTTTTFSDHPLGYTTWSINNITETFGAAGVFYVAIMVLVVGMAAIFSPLASIVLTAVGLIVGWALGIASISSLAILLITSVAGMLLFALRRGAQ